MMTFDSRCKVVYSQSASPPSCINRVRRMQWWWPKFGGNVAHFTISLYFKLANLMLEATMWCNIFDWWCRTVVVTVQVSDIAAALTDTLTSIQCRSMGRGTVVVVFMVKVASSKDHRHNMAATLQLECYRLITAHSLGLHLTSLILYIYVMLIAVKTVSADQ